MTETRVFAVQLLLIVAFLCLGGCSNPRSECDEIRRIANDQAIRNHLTEWVAENIENTMPADLKLVAGGGRWPGFHSVDLDFEWQKLNSPKTDWQIRVIGRLSDNPDELYHEINAVSFGYRSRFGILVKISDSDSFGIDPGRLEEINDNVAIVCDNPY